MAQEIERKFLVDVKTCPLPAEGVEIVQGYIPTATRTVVRVRLKGDRAFLTLKGENRGAVRAEFEYSIPVADAREILASLCSEQVVEKTRYEIAVGDHLWEVDIFAGRNRGLCIAEVELAAEDERVELPPWVGKEVTGEARYYNSSLVDNPFSAWPRG